MPSDGIVRQHRVTRQGLKIVRVCNAGLKGITAESKADARSEAHQGRAKEGEQGLREGRNNGFHGRRNHTNVVFFEAFLLLRRLGAGQIGLEDGLVDELDALEFAELASQIVVEPGRAGHQGDARLKAVFLRSSDVVGVLQVRDDPGHFARDRTLDLATLGSRIDQQRKALGIVCREIGLLARHFGLLLPQLSDQVRSNHIRYGLERAIACGGAACLVVPRPGLRGLIASRRQLVVQSRELLLVDRALAIRAVEGMAAGDEIMVFPKPVQSFLRSAELLA